MNLKELIENEKIVYYKGARLNLKKMEENPREFIEDYLNAGDKSSDDIKDLIYRMSEDRAYHSISIYLLGIIFYKKIDKLKNIIDIKIKKINKEVVGENKVSFLYYWFLICFFHDVFSDFQESKENPREKVCKLLGNGINSKNIEEEVLSRIDNIINVDKDLVPNVLVENIKGYYQYIIHNPNGKITNGIINHGFIGGIYYFYFLENKIKEIKDGFNEGNPRFKLYNENKGVILDTVTDLVWDERFLDIIHREIATIIICHDIWYCNKGDKDENQYKKYNLSNLIIEESMINIEKHSLYFLFTFVDTIDFYKMIKGNLEKDSQKNSKKDYDKIFKSMLNDIELEFEKNSVKIKTNYKNSIVGILHKNKYWLPIEYEEFDEYIKIKFKCKNYI